MICVTYMPVCLKTGQMTIKIQDLKLYLKNKQAKQTNKNKTITVTQTTRKN